MGNFIRLLINIANKTLYTPTPTPTQVGTPTPTPTPNIETSKIQKIIEGMSDKERLELIDKAQNFNPDVPFSTTSVTDNLPNLYEDNIETFINNFSYLENTRNHKMSQGIFNRNTDSIVLGPNTFSK